MCLEDQIKDDLYLRGNSPEIPVGFDLSVAS